MAGTGECPTQKVRVERPLYEQEQLHKALEYEKPKTNYSLSNTCGTCRPGKFIFEAIPILNWLPHYKWRTDFLQDVIAGFTVAIMHIPQGMAYALLGNVPPVVGLYMAFFPVIVYFFFGTSRHVSMGTFAVVCLMTGKVVSTYSSSTAHISLQDNNRTYPIVADAMVQYSPIEVATAVTLMAGFIQIFMYIFRMGILSTLLSETLVNGFITGAAVHVVTSQIKDLFGFTIPKYNGFLNLIHTYIAIFHEIPNLNVAATITSAVTIAILVFNNEILKGWVAKKTSFPVPIELIAVVIGTLVSKYAQLPALYGVATVGTIPTGLPVPTLPPVSLLHNVILDSFTIAMVGYTVSLSMALIFAQKVNYEVDANQELLAQGLGNMFGSFFSCLPFSASLSRSMIQFTAGGVTQLASIISCVLLLTILLWIGPFFEALPKCVLASIIVVALKGMLMQATALIKFWHTSKFDATVWLVTFITNVFFDIDIGLLAGLIISLTTIFIQGMKPYTCLLGSVPNTDLYLDVNRYKGTIELPGIKIFHYCGALNFASRDHFKNELFRLVGVQPQKELIRRKKIAKRESQLIKNGITNEGFEDNLKENNDISNNKKCKNIPIILNCLIIDFSALSYTDPSGVNALRSLAAEFMKIDIPVYIAGCSGPVYEMIKKCDKYENKQSLMRIFPTVNDAVQSANVLTISLQNTSPNFESVRL